MTYRVYCDGLLLYHSKLDSMRIFDASVEVELNKNGSFVFTVYPDHPYYWLIRKLKSIVTVYQDDYLLFRGRVLDEKVGWYNEKVINCEEELAFLHDSVQKPYEYSGTVEGYLNLLITEHNAQVDESKWFTVGNVTAGSGDISAANEEYSDTWTEMQKRLIDELGGYITVRHEGYINYIDYVQDFSKLSPQKITFGKNLIGMTRARKGADIATVIVPLGAKVKDADGRDTKDRLTIAGVNDGLVYLQDDTAIAQYGRIVKVVTFDEITDAAALMTAGQAQLAESVKMVESVDLTAADMATAGVDIESFHIGVWVDVESNPHGVDGLFLVRKLSIQILNPAANKLTLSKTIMGFSEAVKGLQDRQEMILQTVEQTAQQATEAVYNVEQNLQSTLDQTAQNIVARVAEDYYLKDDTDALISSVSTEVQQTKDSFEIQFNQFSQDIASVAAGTDAEFEEIRKYIRFVDGMILLGEVGNELELQISNDRISFLQDGAEVAYFSNRKLYITDAQVIHSLQIGGFAFMPRANGNTSFKKV